MKAGTSIGVALKLWRDTYGYSRREAASMLVVSSASIRHWEEGRSCGVAGPVLSLMRHISAWHDVVKSESLETVRSIAAKSLELPED